MALHPKIDQALKKRQVLKVILGLSNFNVKNIIRKVQAAEIGGATYIDIAANPEIIKEVRKISQIPICVSSIDIDELYKCFIEGADILEIGNFDIFYGKNISFTSQQIIDLTKELLSRAPDASICVTVPHSLNINEQILLAKQLQNLGIDMIQTEGISSKLSSTNHLFDSIYHASAALSSTYIFGKYTDLPIISSSGLNTLTTPVALAYGASGVGIGSFFDSANTILDMTIRIQNVIQAMYSYHSIDSQLQNYLLDYSASIYQTNKQSSIQKGNLLTYKI